LNFAEKADILVYKLPGERNMRIFKEEALLYENSQSYVYRTIKQNIVALSLEPGESISETELTSIFKISRSPVRSALSHLNEEGLVVIAPQRRTIVSKLDAEYILQSSFTRNLIEAELITEIINEGKADHLCDLLTGVLDSVAADLRNEKSVITARDLYGLLCKDVQFHGLIYEAAGRKKLLDCLRLPYQHYNRFQSLHLRSHIENGTFIPHHMELVEMIKRRDIDAISARKEENVANVKAVLAQSFTLHPEYF